ncbi:malonyl-CoA decarboxylase [Pseudoxanthobacter sp.]|uniref:malonyl-CoA decarboxylase n=1 Tax=Pseudoxanthobacter sp. TaxID=1925742 RepID=UPI002FDFD5D9
MKALLTGLSNKSVSGLMNELLESLSLRARPRAAKEPTGALQLQKTIDALLSRRGEASGVVLASLALDGYEEATADEKTAFLSLLADAYGVDGKAVAAAAQAYLDTPDAGAAETLHRVSEPRRREVLRRLNLAPGGTLALVRMREDVMARLRGAPGLKALDRDFADLFAIWFSRGFLDLRHIDWQTPAAILEKIIRYEAVHVIESWDDLRNRLAPSDRRCFAFFHPQLPDEPLIFVEVALTTAIPAAIGPLLDLERGPIAAEAATTAVFYSISNTQKGLAGVSFGNFLIKQVVEDLRHELPNLKTFVTLSPVPGFAKWLKAEREKGADGLLPEAERTALAGLDAPGWEKDPAQSEALKAPLLSAAARYFLEAKLPNGRLPDPVGRFHLGNGARLERLNFLGDLSAQGLAQSHGLMVNYLYDLGHIETNHEEFVERGVVAASSEVRKCLKAEPPPKGGKAAKAVARIAAR